MARKPEYHVENIEDESHICTVNNAIDRNAYIKCLISKEDIGNLLQGKSVSLLFLNDNYESTGMIDIILSNAGTNFNVSKRLIDMIDDMRG